MGHAQIPRLFSLAAVLRSELKFYLLEGVLGDRDILDEGHPFVCLFVYAEIAFCYIA